MMATLVLLPGMDGTGELFGDFISACESRFSTVVLSYPVDRPLDYAALTQRSLESLPRDAEYFLLAESFSGPIGIAIAATQPPGLRGLILVCSFSKSPRWAPVLMRGALSAAPIAMLAPLFASPLLLGRFSSDRRRKQMLAAISRVTPPVWRARLGAVLNVDVSEKLTDIRVPVLCVSATEDRLVPKSAVASIARRVREMHTIDIEGPHMLLQVSAMACANRIQAFVQSMNTQT